MRVVALTNDTRLASSWGVLLAAVALPHRVVDSVAEPLIAPPPEESARYYLVVSVEDAQRAQALLDAQREEEQNDKAQALPEEAVVPGAPWAMTLGLCALLAFMFVRSPGFNGLSERFLLDSGAVRGGEWWRVVTAIFLHADAGHLADNLIFLAVGGYFVSRRLGSGHMFAAFIFSGVVGFMFSVIAHPPPFESLGASGGIFGLWGVLVGAALFDARWRRGPLQRRRELYGAGAALVGLTAFSVHADMTAHVGGFFAGLCYGFVPWRRLGMIVDRVLGLAGFALVAFAFHAAAR